MDKFVSIEPKNQEIENYLNKIAPDLCKDILEQFWLYGEIDTKTLLDKYTNREL